MTRVAVSRDDGRAEVLARAAVAISQHGYHGMTMRDLAKATGRGLASFYHLFQSKEDILFELQSQAFEQLLDTAERALAEIPDPVGRLQIFVLNHVRYFVEQPDVMRVLVQEASALPRPRRAEIRALKQRYFELGQGVLRVVVASKSTVSDLELERMTYSMFGMLNWIYGWYEPARHGTPEELARTIQNLVLHGAVAPPPLHDASWDAVGRVLDGILRPPLLRQLPKRGPSR
ncbi:MAG TPA: TetR/AcrR family transcriptional regulator [Polyangiaceae bacterium]